jgi:hypothetical protein
MTFVQQNVFSNVFRRESYFNFISRSFETNYNVVLQPTHIVGRITEVYSTKYYRMLPMQFVRCKFNVNFAYNMRIRSLRDHGYETCPEVCPRFRMLCATAGFLMGQSHVIIETGIIGNMAEMRNFSRKT